VNHSSFELTGIGLRIAVRSAAASANGLSPLFTLSARVPVLGPHESKEIRTTVELGAYNARDWEVLKTDVKVVSEQ
ncbi:MAG: hypothetical protein JO022_19805, partial [Acidobacteriaceae bacterium]|nr:hypothetical protein [Acidobacteriaceae bacterium]